MSSMGQLLCYRSVADLWPFTCSQFYTCRESQTLFRTLLETDFLYMDTFQTELMSHLQVGILHMLSVTPTSSTETPTNFVN